MQAFAAYYPLQSVLLVKYALENLPVLLTIWHPIFSLSGRDAVLGNACLVSRRCEISRAKVFYVLRPYIRKTELDRGAYSMGCLHTRTILPSGWV